MNKQAITADARREKTFDRFLFVLAVGFILLIVFHRTQSYRELFLNWKVPVLIFTAGSLVGIIFFFLLRFYVFGFRENLRMQISNKITLMKVVFISMVTFGWLATVAFDLMNLRQLENVERQIALCKIYKIDLSNSGTHNTIDFDFQGKELSINNFIPDKEIQAAAKEHDYNNYLLEIEYKKGLWSSIVLYNHKLVSK
jgi:hypothetical protein